MPAQSHPESERTGRVCSHVSTIIPIRPHSDVCLECVKHGHGWVELWVCLSCGWVACSENSPDRHARSHYEETDHPVAAALGPAHQNAGVTSTTHGLNWLLGFVE